MGQSRCALEFGAGHKNLIHSGAAFGRWPKAGLHRGWTGIEKEAYYNDIPQIISAGGNQFLATRGGESQQNIFKSHRRRALERGRTLTRLATVSVATNIVVTHLRMSIGIRNAT